MRIYLKDGTLAATGRKEGTKKERMEAAVAASSRRLPITADHDTEFAQKAVKVVVEVPGQPPAPYWIHGSVILRLPHGIMVKIVCAGCPDFTYGERKAKARGIK